MPVFSATPPEDVVCRWCLTVIQTVLGCEHDARPEPE